MLDNVKDLQNYTKNHVEVTTAKSVTFAKGFQEIASEATAFSKAQFDMYSEVFKKLLGAKSLPEAIQIQTDYAKSSYEAFVAQGAKVTEMFQGLAKKASEPIEAPTVKYATDSVR